MPARLVLGLAIASLLAPIAAAAQLPSQQYLASAAEACSRVGVGYFEHRLVPLEVRSYPGYPVPDPTFVPSESRVPTYPFVTEDEDGPLAKPGPVIAIDSTHDNGYSLHTDCPRYAAFQALLELDGATVVDFGVPFTDDCVPDDTQWFEDLFCHYLQVLSAVDILVIVAPTSIGEAEAQVLRDWVSGSAGCTGGDCSGRGLIVVTAEELPQLGSQLGLTWSDTRTRGAEFTTCGPPRQPVLSLPGALIDHHVVQRGFDADEAVSSVKTFFNGVLRVIGGSPTWAQMRYRNATIPLPTASSSVAFLSHEGGETAAGVAIELGEGRVFAGTDPEMFTAVIAEPLCTNYFGIPGCSYPKPLGMQVHPPNQQFLLNLVHWMDGLLPDADGDGITDANDLCRFQPPEVWPYGPYDDL